jgi:hypothetical protein
MDSFDMSCPYNACRSPAARATHDTPITQQFHMVDLGPRLDESLLRSRKATADAFNRIESVRGKCVLI